jgi:hypothetical protein
MTGKYKNVSDLRTSASEEDKSKVSSITSNLYFTEDAIEG